ncbi:SMP-30/Gluconolaconase/LRE-like region [Colletotrichum graminicola]|uniref:SMP-30/Gluconolaconase/LRE-like region n=1 Tax=Colletotrichum graminicola (strain M1.001 / M2 / FGSC 10212) TaxID=645133 RepID=E3Q9D5_COLGM|nr:SMP-30/Gluconolaconase/LRE-like region [Colletotrichum graminicola M1.001]EFQ27314.1 SMP-30/Gluconolaconase/LRE-like region [Colletotrichum graminicola M1.001]WDK13099.1 SMP-30/Gluconolaconase/LRE-like region [Colletotrichum graminicola]
MAVDQVRQDGEQHKDATRPSFSTVEEAPEPPSSSPTGPRYGFSQFFDGIGLSGGSFKVLPSIQQVALWFQAASMSLINVDLHALATGGAGYLASINAANLSTPAISLLSYQPSFVDVVGANATARKIADLDWQAFHEGGIYNKKDNSLYISSNYRSLQDNINITVVSLDDLSVRSTQFPDLAEANGGSSYYPPGADQSATPPMQVWCDQGDFQAYSKLLAVDVNTNKSETLIIGFNGRNFSAVNDVRQHPVTGDLWFTDAEYGLFQHFRGDSQLPRQVYRFEPATGLVQAVADDFHQPNGIEFSPDYKTLYVSDTGAQRYDANFTRPATIYAYDVVGGGKRLANRRLFAFADNGLPDGVHTDTDGNVWAGCGDGVHVWNPDGVLLGKIHVGETANNFAFAPGKVFVFSNYRLWVVEGINALGREVCKDFGADSDPRCAK